MKTLPLVSIVTPAYNQAEYLAETIESVLAQDYPNIEYIVMDDGSTDATPEVIKRYKGRITSERHENVGQARTLNRGWAASTGLLIGYLSSDDRLERHAVTRLVQAFAENPNAAVSYGDFALIDTLGRRFRTVRTEEFDLERLTVNLVCQPGAGALFRREVFEQAKGWTEHLRQVPDFEFWLRASNFGQFVHVPEVLADYRVHEGSASFQPTIFERSMEIVGVMESFWAGRSGRAIDCSMATAHLIAAKSHLQSGRVVTGASQWIQALKRDPPTALRPEAWQMLFSGLLRRIAYRWNGRSRRIT